MSLWSLSLLNREVAFGDQVDLLGLVVCVFILQTIELAACCV